MAHLFWDNSNIWIGGQEVCAVLEPNENVYDFRIHARNMLKLVRRRETLPTREVAGSIPPQAEEVWAHFGRLGFRTNLLKRVDNLEQYVDEALLLKIAHTLLVNTQPDILIILSGDGSPSESGHSFPQYMQIALDNGWRVWCYSWSGSTSGDIQRLLRGHPNGEWIDLTPHYHSVTFIKDVRRARRP